MKPLRVYKFYRAWVERTGALIPPPPLQCSHPLLPTYISPPTCTSYHSMKISAAQGYAAYQPTYSFPRTLGNQIHDPPTEPHGHPPSNFVAKLKITKNDPFVLLILSHFLPSLATIPTCMLQCCGGGPQYRESPVFCVHQAPPMLVIGTERGVPTRADVGGTSWWRLYATRVSGWQREEPRGRSASGYGRQHDERVRRHAGVKKGTTNPSGRSGVVPAPGSVRTG